MASKKQRGEGMWCLTMFDLPTKTLANKRAYREFRDYLLDIGFVKVQYSVYAKYSPSGMTGSRTVLAVKSALPPGGEVRIVTITDNQWAKAFRFRNGAVENPEETPEQLLIF